VRRRQEVEGASGLPDVSEVDGILASEPSREQGGRLVQSVAIRAIGAGLGYAVQATLALELKGGHFASYAAMYAAVGIAAMVGSRGAPTVAAREQAKDRDVRRILLGSAGSTCLVALVLIGAAWVLPSLGGSRSPGLLAGAVVSLVGISSSEVMAGWARGTGAIDRAFANLAVGQAFSLVLVVLWSIWTEVGVGQALALVGVGQLVGATLCYFTAAARARPSREDGDRSGINSLLFVGVASQVALSVDRLVAPVLLLPGQADLYAKAAVLAGRPLQLLSVVVEQYFLPLYARGIGPTAARIRATVIRPLFLAGPMLMAIAVGVSVSGSKVGQIAVPIAVLSAYVMYPIYSVLAADIWSRGGTEYQLRYLKRFVPLVASVLGIWFLLALRLRSPLVLAWGAFVVVGVRNLVMLGLAKRTTVTGPD